MNKEILSDFIKSADAVSTTNHNTVGTYDAVVWKGEKVYRVTTEALNPLADGMVETITENKARNLLVWERV